MTSVNSEGFKNADFYTIGGKMINIYTLGDIIPFEDIKLLSTHLEKDGVEVIVNDMENQVTAFETELSNVISFVLQTPILAPIIALTGHSATWDAIKVIAKSTWNRVKGQKYTRYYSSRTEVKDITVGISARINNNEFSFNLDGIQSGNDVAMAMDKILDFLREQKQSQQWQTYYGRFNNDSKQWEIKELGEIIDEQRIKSSK
jgi:hypothetical protein